jgi:hypothetical protein
MPQMRAYFQNRTGGWISAIRCLPTSACKIDVTTKPIPCGATCHAFSVTKSRWLSRYK